MVKRFELEVNASRIENKGVDIWLSAAPRWIDESRRVLWESWLDAQERERLAGFLFHRHRMRFLHAHALVRAVLSLYAPVFPAEWRFVLEPQGRPRLANGDLTFSLSHCGTLAACAISREPETGLDVENPSRLQDLAGIAQTNFSESERELLGRETTPDFSRRFFQIWTMKEAYAKARGLGLGMDFPGFSCLPCGNGACFKPPADDTACWQFESQTAAGGEQIALAIRGQGWRVRARPFTL